MADKAITELVAAEQITATDLFVLQQNDTAKKLPGQVLLNWLTAAADGHGGVQDCQLLKTEGLVKTYRFTLADKTHIDIDVVDGRGVEDVQKVKAEGLVDTYQIIYNDGPPGTFTVTNGAKGDKGANADIWIRYASQKPTAESHSFGEIPDAWIGVASGHLPTAPTDWQAYTWYQWKGDKGDKGDPAVLNSSEITYQVGASGTVIPSGSWTASIPAVTPGKYLWIRQVLKFNTGSPVTIHSVSRFGIDGTGAVSSVAGIAPDETGNVPLDAGGLNALSLLGGTMAGSINMNGQSITGLNPPVGDTQPVTKKYMEDNAEKKKLMFFNQLVAVSSFVSDGTYSDYPYRAAISLSGVTSGMIPEVILGLTDAVSGIFSPVSATYDGGVYIYATDKPSGNITIPTIICWEGG